MFCIVSNPKPSAKKRLFGEIEPNEIKLTPTSNVSTPKKRVYKSQNVQVELALNLQKKTNELLEKIVAQNDEILQEIRKLTQNK